MAERLFILLLLAVIAQRVGELRLAKRNEQQIRSLGGYEWGRDHYKYIVLLHVLFFISMLWEAAHNGISPPPWWIIPFLGWLSAQFLRYRIIRTLGIFWNTRIMVLPGAERVTSGPYRRFRHPNYAVVTFELLVIPLIFGLYLTAALFPVINMLLLESVRIPAEEEALYQAAMAGAESDAEPRAESEADSSAESDVQVTPSHSTPSRSGRPIS